MNCFKYFIVDHAKFTLFSVQETLTVATSKLNFVNDISTFLVKIKDFHTILYHLFYKNAIINCVECVFNYTVHCMALYYEAPTNASAPPSEPTVEIWVLCQ